MKPPASELLITSLYFGGDGIQCVWETPQDHDRAQQTLLSIARLLRHKVTLGTSKRTAIEWWNLRLCEVKDGESTTLIQLQVGTGDRWNTQRPTPNLELPVVEARVPTCWNCVHASKYPGTHDSMAGPGDPAETFCNAFGTEYAAERPLDDVERVEAIIEAAQTDARSCPYFTPVLIDLCAECHAPMFVPEHNWKWWANPQYGEAGVCSENCQMQSNDRAAEEERASHEYWAERDRINEEPPGEWDDAPDYGAMG